MTKARNRVKPGSGLFIVTLVVAHSPGNLLHPFPERTSPLVQPTFSRCDARLKVSDRFAIVGTEQPTGCVGIDVFRDKSNTTVSE